MEHITVVKTDKWLGDFLTMQKSRGTEPSHKESGLQ